MRRYLALAMITMTAGWAAAMDGGYHPDLQKWTLDNGLSAVRKLSLSCPALSSWTPYAAASGVSLRPAEGPEEPAVSASTETAVPALSAASAALPPSADTGADRDASAVSDAGSGVVGGGQALRSGVLRKQETYFPTVITRPENSPARVGQAVFTANLVYLSVLNAADYVTTRAALKHEGLVEANPLMRPFVNNATAFAAVKASLSLGSVLILKNLYKKNKALAWVASLAANAALSYVVVSNLKMIRNAEQRSVCQ